MVLSGQGVLPVHSDAYNPCTEVIQLLICAVPIKQNYGQDSPENFSTYVQSITDHCVTTAAQFLLCFNQSWALSVFGFTGHLSSWPSISPALVLKNYVYPYYIHEYI